MAAEQLRHLEGKWVYVAGFTTGLMLGLAWPILCVLVFGILMFGDKEEE